MDLFHLLEQQDMVLRISFSILILMSIISWSIIFIRLLKLVGMKGKNKKMLNAFWQSNNIKEAQEKADKDRSVISSVLRKVLPSYLKYQQNKTAVVGLQAQLSLKDYLTLNISNAITQTIRPFESGLVALASIGAVAPFIGLFGTVWGIFNALMDISQQGQVSIATVSAPIGEALVATAMGLFVAIPAVLAYNAITRLNRNISQDLDSFAHDLYIYLLNHQENK
ncbi:outer membrane transport energization protein ExbB [Bisgaardia hudsonensis]|uniref:Biopolymer transport protein ExbB n=1 Tax=Bisgaardia hudsonensis TaxID=109472 RepID=A0A4R2MT59_9PAST|nr:MotA/TolQ/ExbB proton channel family protein [Bisgaardia hudsonensis]QLB12122.1 biopolymer transporter ExbB [Bisgaardia hudsonensis]TCP11480.1 outer membrane transport energization protein ExbB [Bisgaardia hudsonensis]